MAIRKILYVVAILIALLGLSQLVFTGWWIRWMPDFVRSATLYLWGLPGLILGVLVIVGILEKVVGLRLLLGAWAVLMIGSGLLLIVKPEDMRGWLYTVFLDRPPWWQVSMIWIGGLLRVLFGVILLYALARPTASMPAAGEPGPPTAPTYPMEQ